MEKAKKILNDITKFTLTAQIKVNNKQISPLVTFILLVLGSAYLVKLLYKGVLIPIIYPFLRKVFFTILKRRSKLLPLAIGSLQSKQIKNKSLKWVLVYGACSHLGRLTAKVFANHEYGLMLIDSNLTKLQDFKHELEKIFPHLAGADGQSLIRIININLGTDHNSTHIEHKLHNAVFGKGYTFQSEETPTRPEESKKQEGIPDTAEVPCASHVTEGPSDVEEMKCPNISVFVNCAGLGKDIRSFNEKMFHEMQFDQVMISCGK